jgi:hypothetical protein
MLPTQNQVVDTLTNPTHVVLCIRTFLSHSIHSELCGIGSKADTKNQNTLFQLNNSDCALLCEVLKKKAKNGTCLLICFISDFNFLLYTRFYSLGRASAVSKFI